MNGLSVDYNENALHEFEKKDRARLAAVLSSLTQEQFDLFHQKAAMFLMGSLGNSTLPAWHLLEIARMIQSPIAPPGWKPNRPDLPQLDLSEEVSE